MLSIWQCRKTGDCCKRFISTGPSITQTEGNAITQNLDNREIAEHLRSIGITKEDVINHIKTRNSLPIIKNQETCAFLKNDECIIHDIKPKVCKDYPLVIEERKNMTLVTVDLDCPRGYGIVQELENNRIPGWLPNDKPIKVEGRSFYEELAREKFGDE